MTSKKRFLAGGVSALLLLAGAAALAQSAPIYDPAQMPETKGTVQYFSLTPRGDVDGLILGDGTEVHFPPHMSTSLVATVKPGDAVTVHGLKAMALPLVSAASITNDATGKTVVDTGPGGRRGGDDVQQVQGRVKATLHGPRGEVNGALLEDGTIVRLPPPEARRLSALLAPGQTVAAEGPGLSNALGKVIEVRRLGPTPEQLSAVDAPRGPHKGPKGPKVPGGPDDRDPPPPPRG